MTLILFTIACALLAAAIVDRWRRRPVLIVSTGDGTYRGRRAPSPRFALVDAELVAGDQHLPGMIVIPRRQIVLIQVLPLETRVAEPAA